MYSEASLISRAPIFLPRYSGVRPTISPATNTAMIASTSIPYRPEPMPPGATSPSIMLKIVDAAAERGERVVERVDRAGRGQRRRAANSADGGTPNRGLLALHRGAGEPAARCPACASSADVSSATDAGPEHAP